MTRVLSESKTTDLTVEHHYSIGVLGPIIDIASQGFLYLLLDLSSLFVSPGRCDILSCGLLCFE